MADPRQGDFITSVHQILTFSISHDFWLNSQEIFNSSYGKDDQAFYKITDVDYSKKCNDILTLGIIGNN